MIQFSWKNVIGRTRLLMSVLMLLFSALHADEHGQRQHQGNRAWPDSLKSVTIDGVAIVDTTFENPYFLDTDFDGVADYKLAFGPDWYQPESGAQRPADGDTINIVGAVHINPVLPLVVVFEINGLVWRTPVEDWWRHRSWSDTLVQVTVTGTVMVDTTYFYEHYYLDENNDGQPDYFLDFGPPWYQPTDVEKPGDGDLVTIEGRLKTRGLLPAIEVYIIDGATWREPEGPPPWAGRWVYRNGRDTVRIYCPIDSLSWVDIPPGAMRGGPHFPDSIFCEFFPIYGDSLPGRPDSVLSGFHFYFAGPNGHHVRGRAMMVRFMRQLRMAFHYGDEEGSQSPLAKILTKDEVLLKYWDQNSNDWKTAEDAIVDSEAKIIYLANQDVNSYYAIFRSSGTTDISTINAVLPIAFKLEQNYPNPFNPATEIKYRIALAGADVSLKIFNLQGQLIKTLVQQVHDAGEYRAYWDGRDRNGKDLASGVYLYRLTVNDQHQVRRLVLLK